ncbi:CLUMA_CG007935, isoform A [Clunio marinus]|uniref:CLUMA_CG007935, isoform A n=1 Tax=Clunio marinus TaxID=568069 RepID=A0A1J1I4B7_9DIPT|nr:CLUMA_CG007935, isoform A [Clunio marinus]
MLPLDSPSHFVTMNFVLLHHPHAVTSQIKNNEIEIFANVAKQKHQTKAVFDCTFFLNHNRDLSIK